MKKIWHSRLVLAPAAMVCAAGCQFSLIKLPDASKLAPAASRPDKLRGGADDRAGGRVFPSVEPEAVPPRSADLTDAELENFYNKALGRDPRQFINNTTK